MKKILGLAGIMFILFENTRPIDKLNHQNIKITQVNSYPLTEVMSENIWNPFAWCNSEIYQTEKLSEEEIYMIKESIYLVPAELRRYMNKSEVIVVKNREKNVSGFYSKFSRFYGCNKKTPLILPGESIILNISKGENEHSLIRSVLLHEFVHSYSFNPENLDLLYKWAKQTGWYFSDGRWVYDGEYCKIFDIGKIYDPFEDLAYSIQYYCYEKTRLNEKRIKLIEDIFNDIDLNYCSSH